MTASWSVGTARTLLPERRQAINAYGIRIKHRAYDSPELNPLRRQRSRVTAKKGLWEVHYDPYDVSRIWVRDSRADRWITVFWKHLHRVGVPFRRAGLGPRSVTSPRRHR
jgi:hypothetical protein